MKCIDHNDIDAVTTCTVCGAGLCKECETNTTYRIDNKPLCKKCNYQIASEKTAESENLIKSTKMKLIIWTVILGVGIIVFFVRLATASVASGIVFMLLIWGLANIGNIFKSQPDNRSVKKQVKDAVEEAKHPVMALIAKPIGFLIGYAIIAVTLPIQLIILLLNRNKQTKLHQDNLTVLNSLNQESA